MPTVVDSSNPIYDALHERWVATGRGSTLTVNGRTFRELDNGACFVRIDVEQGSPDSMNAMYASTAIRPVEPIAFQDIPAPTMIITEHGDDPVQLGDEDAARNGLPQGSEETEGSQEDESAKDDESAEDAKEVVIGLLKTRKPRKPKAKPVAEEVSNDEQSS